jgi:hypothetical protein
MPFSYLSGNDWGKKTNLTPQSICSIEAGRKPADEKRVLTFSGNEKDIKTILFRKICCVLRI